MYVRTSACTHNHKIQVHCCMHTIRVYTLIHTVQLSPGDGPAVQLCHHEEEKGTHPAIITRTVPICSYIKCTQIL